MGNSSNVYFSQFGSLGNPGSRCWQIWRLMRTCSLVCRWQPSHSVLTWQRKEASSLVSFLVRTLIPSWELHSHQPYPLMHCSSLILEDSVPLFVLFPKADRAFPFSLYVSRSGRIWEACMTSSCLPPTALGDPLLASCSTLRCSGFEQTHHTQCHHSSVYLPLVSRHSVPCPCCPFGFSL